MLSKSWRCQLFVLLLIFGCIFSGGCIKKRFERGYTFESPELNLYNVAREITVSGTVISQVGLLYDEEVPTSMLRLTSDDQKKYIVQLGPSWYLKMQRVGVTSGDRVMIVGSTVGRKEVVPTGEGSGEQTENELITLLARTLKNISQKTVLISLRDESGKPMWYGKGRAIGKQKYLEEMIEKQKSTRQKPGQGANEQQFPF